MVGELKLKFLLVKYFCLVYCYPLATHNTFIHTCSLHIPARPALCSICDLTIGQRIFKGLAIKFPRMIRVRIDKLTVFILASRLSKVHSVQNVLLYQSSSRYSITLYSLSDLTIGLGFSSICYVRRIGLTNSALTK